MMTISSVVSNISVLSMQGSKAILYNMYTELVISLVLYIVGDGEDKGNRIQRIRIKYFYVLRAWLKKIRN